MTEPDQHSGLAGELVHFLCGQPAAHHDLLRGHRDDGTGHCAICTAGGQTGRLIWPRQIYTAAHQAAQQAADQAADQAANTTTPLHRPRWLPHSVPGRRPVLG